VSVKGLVLLLLTALVDQDRDPGLLFPAQRAGDVVATLALRVPEQGAAPGRARVVLTLHVRGPAGLEVEGPRLDDALDAWRVDWAASSWTSDDGTADWEQTLELIQVKPGMVPLPGVMLRVRDGPAAKWEEAAWPDLLHEPRDVPGPEKLPPLPPSAWPGWLFGLAIALGAGLGLALLVRAGRRWRAAGRPAVPAHQRALARLDAMPIDPVAAAHHLDEVLRGYLQECFGIEAMRKTTRELLAVLAEQKILLAEHQSLLKELLGWCDVAKFAGGPQLEDVRDAAGRTRAFVLATAPGETRRDGEGRESGEKRTSEQPG
jgi:hypothetical protein